MEENRKKINSSYRKKEASDLVYRLKKKKKELV